MQTYLLSEENEAEESSAFFKKIGEKLLSLWPWMIGSVILGLALAFLYLKLATPEYKIHASLLVQDDKRGSSMGTAELLEDFGLPGGKSNVDNEAEVFKSRTITEKVVRDLQLYVQYAATGKMKTSELYEESPVTLQFIHPHTDSLKKPNKYTIQFDAKDSSKVIIEHNEKKTAARFGDLVFLKEGMARISKGALFGKWPAEKPVTILVNSFDAAVRKYQNALNVQIPNKQVSVIYLTLKEVLPAKGEHILNTLISTYINESVNDKNRIADSTMQFIDERLALVTVELSGIEKDIEGFKTANKLTDINTQAQLLLENSSEYTKQQTEKEVQLSVVKALEAFLLSNQHSREVVPASLVMQDPIFVALVNRYNDMQLQRDKMLMSLTPTHPTIQLTNDQLKNIRAELISSIRSVKNGIEVSIAELRKKNSAFDARISNVPAKQRIFIDFSRQQAIKEELYLFLLKKREETAISKSATIANSSIMDAAKAEPGPSSPQKNIILLAGVIFGIFIPLGASFLKDTLNNRITSVEDINKMTRAPILAEIGHNKTEEVIAVTLESRSIISEQFRSLRTNLQYLLTSTPCKTVLITSSMSGEGKSFTSINLCSALALAGKKVILLEMDLRKPKISVNLKLKKEGFTNFIIAPDGNWQQWLQTTGAPHSFDVMASGPLPPNPTELLMLPKTIKMFEEMKQAYDYIIIDTSPAGLVTDAEILAAQAEVTFYIVRHQQTFKNQISLIDKLFLKNTFPRLNLIVNDVTYKKPSYGYNYGYGYGYGLQVNGIPEKKRNGRMKKQPHEHQ